jgi:hypothetical protein
MHPDGRAGRGALGRIGGRRTVIGEPAVASPDRRSDPAGRGGTRRRYVAAERERRVSGSGEHPSTGLSRDTDGAILEKPTASFSCRSRYRRRFRKSPRAICAQPFPMQSAKLRNGLAHTRSRQTWRRFASSPLAYSADTSPALPGCRWLPRSSGDFAEPSDGLEPSTPSLPCAPERLPWVATGCGLACLSGFRGRLICHWLRPLGSINAPSSVPGIADGQRNSDGPHVRPRVLSPFLHGGVILFKANGSSRR